MKKPPNLQQKLFDSGLIEKGTIKEIAAFKKRHRTEYVKQYNSAFSTDKKQKLLVFTLDEFQQLETLSKQYKMKLSPFIKASIFAYHNNSYIPIDKHKISDIEALLREINGRISQSIQYVHLSNEISLKDLESIKQAIFELEKSIAQTLHQPPSLEVWLKNQQAKDEQFISTLLESIAQFLTKNHDY